MSAATPVHPAADDDFDCPTNPPETPLSSRGRRPVTSRPNPADMAQMAVEHFNHLIDQHDKQFNDNVRLMNRFIKLMRVDHQESLDSLRAAIEEFTNSRSHHVRRPAAADTPETATDSGQKTGETANNQPEVDSSFPPAENENATQPATSGASDAQDLHQPQLLAQQTRQPSRGESAIQETLIQVQPRDAAVSNPSIPQPTRVATQSPALDGARIRDVQSNPMSDQVRGNSLVAEAHTNDVNGDNLQSGLKIEPDTSLREAIHATEEIDMIDTPTPDAEDGDFTIETTLALEGARSSSNRPVARATAQKWTDEEEEAMIEIIHALMNDNNRPSGKVAMWRVASALMKEKGYDRASENMMAKWSSSTRQKCSDRNLDWAASVMGKMPHSDVKRKRQSGMGGQYSDSQANPGTRNRKRSKLSKVANQNGRGRNAAAANNFSSFLPGNQLRPQLTWGRAASDVVEVNWAPDGRHFVAGSTAVVDPADTEFKENRPRNLLYGSRDTDTIRELPDHREQRPGQTTTESPGYFYQTVSAVRHTSSGHRMISAGFDRVVRFWDVENESSIKLTGSVRYGKPLQVLDLAEGDEPLVATGTESGTRSVRVFSAASHLRGTPESICPLHNPKPYKPNFAYSPTCLRFGRGWFKDWLIGGFGQDAADGNPSGDGRIKVWRFHDGTFDQIPVAEGNTIVFDCAWSPSSPMFAVGCATDLSTRQDPAEFSIVKLFSTQRPDPVGILSCRAKDMNEITMSGDLVTASCTDGATYVWDMRKSQKPLHRLAHGTPVLRLPAGIDRELSDVGVRFVEWDHEPAQLYTGGSDGILKRWDIRLSPADVCIGDIADVGAEIMCGRFSPDHSSLLIGDDDGYLHLLSKSTTPIREGKFKFEAAGR